MKRLEKVRKDFQWDADYLPPLRLLKPLGEGKISTMSAIDYESALPEEAHPPVTYLAGRAASLTRLPVLLAKDVLRGHDGFESLEEYDHVIVPPAPEPLVKGRWQEDLVFAWQRVAGMNPLVICGVDAVPETFAVTDARLAGVLREGLTLAGEAAAGNLFLCDYRIVAGIEPATDEHGTRRVFPCLALFHTDRSADDHAPLLPLAIQIGLDPNPDMVFTPADGLRWAVAKVVAQAADIHHHEMGPHLLREHFLQEPFAVATWRQLSERHPVFTLLAPHFRILLFNNYEGRQLLVNPGGKVDTLMGGGRDGGLKILSRDYSGDAELGLPPWDWSEWALPADIARRKMEGLPTYPYRDDAQLLWRTIGRFVTGYLDLYYANDSDVVADTELAAWRAELVSPEGANLPSVPEITTRKSLVDVLTTLLFIAGPRHSALNFSQYAFGAIAGNLPLALYAEIPADLATWSDERVRNFLFKLLPPPDQCCEQLHTMGELTSYKFDQLGEFTRNDFTDPAVKQLLKAYQTELAGIVDEINTRNEQVDRRVLRYKFLSPDQVLNSTSI